jgi:hypothetical protein
MGEAAEGVLEPDRCHVDGCRSSEYTSSVKTRQFRLHRRVAPDAILTKDSSKGTPADAVPRHFSLRRLSNSLCPFAHLGILSPLLTCTFSLQEAQ